jgi:hypothetical protein
MKHMQKSLILIAFFCFNLSVNAQKTNPFILWDENLAFPSKEEIPVLDNAEFSEGPGESHPEVRLGYPHACEYKGNLYIAYSDNGGKVGRPKSNNWRETANNNSAELAINPIEMLTSH